MVFGTMEIYKKKQLQLFQVFNDFQCEFIRFQ